MRNCLVGVLIYISGPSHSLTAPLSARLPEACWLSLCMLGATAQYRSSAYVGPSSWNHLPWELTLQPVSSDSSCVPETSEDIINVRLRLQLGYYYYSTGVFSYLADQRFHKPGLLGKQRRCDFRSIVSQQTALEALSQDNWCFPYSLRVSQDGNHKPNM